MTTHFQKAKSQDAQIFTVCMRVVESAFQALFSFSGEDGIYVEPRAPDGRSTDGQYHTVWLPRQSALEAKATRATLGIRSSLVRVGARYGVKVHATHAQAAHTKLRPADPFFESGSRVVYRWPWGTSKQNLHDMFERWGWKAQGIQPAGRSADGTGLMWVVHASGDPPSLVYTLQHGDVVVLREEQSSKDVWKPPRMHVSTKTMKKYDEVADGEFDPWATAASKLSKKAPAANASSLAALEATIDQKIASRLVESKSEQDATMSDVHEPRIAVLEQQIPQLQANQTTMMQQAGTFEKKLDCLNQHIEAQGACFAKTIESQLADQMTRIEALIEKRSRHE